VSWASGVIAVATVVFPELIAPVRRALAWLLALSGLGLLALGAALPSDILAAVAVAVDLGSALLVRVVFGSSAGVRPAQAESTANSGSNRWGGWSWSWPLRRGSRT